MRLGMFLCAVMCSHDGAYLFLMSCVMCCPMYYVLQHHFILISNKIELELELEPYHRGCYRSVGGASHLYNWVAG